MTVLIMNNGLSVNFNTGIKPPTECFSCHGTNLKHEFTAGEYSDQYSSSTCVDCQAITGHALGMLHFEKPIENGLTMSWFECPPDYPIESLKEAAEIVSIKRDRETLVKIPRLWETPNAINENDRRLAVMRILSHALNHPCR